MRCAVTEDLNRQLARLDQSETKDEAIEEEAESLMEKGQDYYPFSVCNVSEAMAEMSATDMDRIAHMLEDGNVAVAGGALFYAIKNYWHHMAKDKAEERVEARWSDCRCHGAGCPRCEPEDRRDYELDR